MNKEITLSDVAKAANVSTATVSRALAAERAGKTPQSIGAVRALETAHKMGYRLNSVASALRTSQSRQIGVVVPDLEDIAVSRIYAGIESAAYGLGYQTFVANSLDDPRLRRQRIEAFKDHGVDGAIIGDAHYDETDFSFLDDLRLPYVLVSRPHPLAPFVVCDDAGGGELAARYLHSRGHKRVAALTGPRHAGNLRLRSQGFSDFFTADIGNCDVIETSLDISVARDDFYSYWTSTQSQVTAVFATTDMLALSVASVLSELNYRIGVDAAVMGFNDSALCQHFPVPLTSISHPLFGMGEQAAQLLIRTLIGGNDRTGGSEPQQILLEPSLSIRRSA